MSPFAGIAIDGILGLLCIPLLAAIVCAMIPLRFVRGWALLASLAGLAIALRLTLQFDPSRGAELQWSMVLPGISFLNSRFGIGLDGISLPLVLLTKLMVPIAILASWKVKEHQRPFMVLYLLLDLALTGTFLATDIFLFYVFWELTLIPMFLLIGVWGSGDRVYASLKFFLYTFAGSIFMLAAILYLVWKSGDGSISPKIASLYSFRFAGDTLIWGLNAEALVFLAFASAFLVKVPLFPFHTWLPDAHVQAPAGGSILLAAVMLKMGIYGLLRIAIPICPQAFEQFCNPLAVLALVGAVYGAWIAFRQTDLKKLVAYSSVSHLALVVLGICVRNEQGLAGAVLQTVNHGLSTGALFFLVGCLYDRRHSRDFSQYGGLAAVMPRFSFFLVLAACSSIGVPGLNGFVGEFLIFWGVFVRSSLWATIAVTGIVFGAIYTLSLISRLLFGQITVSENHSLRDLDTREVIALMTLALAMIVLGVFPGLLLKTSGQFTGHFWSGITHGVEYGK